MKHLFSRLLPSNSRPEGDPHPPHSIDEVDRLLAQGNELEAQGQHTSALEFYQNAARAAPTNPKTHLNIGNALQHLRRFDEAAASFRDAIAVAPDYAPGRFNLGSLLASRGDHAAAEAQLRGALHIDPRMAEAAVLMSVVTCKTPVALQRPSTRCAPRSTYDRTLR